MKKTLVLFALLVSFLFASAQKDSSSDFHLYDKGKYVVSLIPTFSSGTSPNIRFGKFFVPKLETGLQLNGFGSNQFKGGVYGRYYFFNSRLTPFAEANLLYSSVKYPGLDENPHRHAGMATNLGIGLAYNGILDHIGISATYGYQGYLNFNTGNFGSGAYGKGYGLFDLRVSYGFGKAQKKTGPSESQINP